VSKLYFRYGAMNSGKSMNIAIIAHNYEERDQEVLIIKPTIDTKSVLIQSRSGLERKVDIPVTPDMRNLRERVFQESLTKDNKLGCVIVDEAQFLKSEQIDELFNIAVLDNIPVICFGLRTDFQTKLFEGSKRLLELAHSIDEMKTICRCGRKAIFNARRVDGIFVLEGSQVAIDGEVEYESKCGECYIRDARGSKEF